MPRDGHDEAALARGRALWMDRLALRLGDGTLRAADRAADGLNRLAALIAKPPPHDEAPTLRYADGAVAAATRSARALFGGAARRAAPALRLCALLDAQAAERVTALIRDGRAFDLDVTAQGRALRLCGRVDGRHAVVEAARPTTPALRDAAPAARPSAEPAPPPPTAGPAAPVAAIEALADVRVAVAAFDAQRRLVYANPAFYDLFALGPDCRDTRPNLRELLDQLRARRLLPEPDDFGCWRAALLALFDAMGPVSRPCYDERWRLPDRRVLHVVGRAGPEGVTLTLDDISPVLRMERWRSEAQRSREMTLDALLDGVVEFGPDGATRGWNSAFLDIWRLAPRDDAVPRSVDDFIALCGEGSPEAAVWRGVRQALGGGARDEAGDQRRRLSDGRTLAVRVAAMPDGKTVAAFTDVTDSERVADALRDRAAYLEAAEAMRASALYEISHGLRTPISAVIGFADLLVTAPADRAQRHVTNIRAAAVALRDGVERLAELVAAGSPSVDTVNRAVSVTPMLHSAAALLERRLLERGARFDFAPVTEVVAQGDPARVRQLIFSLLSEAADKVDPGGVVRLSVRDGGGTVEIVCDADCADAARPVSAAFVMAQRTAAMHDAALTREPPRDGRTVYLLRTARSAAD